MVERSPGRMGSVEKRRVARVSHWRHAVYLLFAALECFNLERFMRRFSDFFPWKHRGGI